MYIILGIFLLLVCYVVYTKLRDKKLLDTVTKTYRGTYSERNLVLKLLKSGIPSQTIFHDLYVKKDSKNYSQIDLVVATKVGILVFEVKDYSGWIFANGSPKWTQVLAHGKQKYKFYNPIMQNNSHIADLRKQLKQFENIPFYSIIVFYGNCVLKEVGHVPYGTFIIKPGSVRELINDILRKAEPAKYSDKYEIIRVLNEAVKNGESKEIQIQHIENIRNKFG